MDRWLHRPEGEPAAKPGSSASTPNSGPTLHDITGDPTVFDDVALRLRRMSIPSAEPIPDDPGALPGAFKIRLSGTRNSAADVGALVDRRYAERGYDLPGQKRDQNLYTFVAYDEGALVGTVSIRLDSADRGLSADELYRDEINQFRSLDQRVCEFTRLAVDASVSKPVLAGLFHTAYLYAARMRGFHLAVIEVNPRHVVFYRRALGFRVIGPERLNERVNAPAVLLCVPFSTVATGLHKNAGQPERSDGRSLYVHGFTTDEEAGILKRLRSLQPSG